MNDQYQYEFTDELPRPLDANRSVHVGVIADDAALQTEEGAFLYRQLADRHDYVWDLKEAMTAWLSDNRHVAIIVSLFFHHRAREGATTDVQRRIEEAEAYLFPALRRDMDYLVHKGMVASRPPCAADMLA